jgi:hypothetical protein
LFLLTVLFQNCYPTKSTGLYQNKTNKAIYTANDFTSVRKYDAHVHVDTDQPAFLQQALANNFRLLTINWDDVNDPPPMQEQQNIALQEIKAFPSRIA